MFRNSRQFHNVNEAADSIPCNHGPCCVETHFGTSCRPTQHDSSFATGFFNIHKLNIYPPSVLVFCTTLPQSTVNPINSTKSLNLQDSHFFWKCRCVVGSVLPDVSNGWHTLSLCTEFLHIISIGNVALNEILLRALWLCPARITPQMSHTQLHLIFSSEG